jgi:hypothetical protein
MERGDRVVGPDPEHRSDRSFASFGDPDGNGWLFQEITARLPGRVDADTSFTSSGDLAAALRRAAAAHGEHEKRTGQRDENWPDWYAARPGSSTQPCRCRSSAATSTSGENSCARRCRSGVSSDRPTSLRSRFTA